MRARIKALVILLVVGLGTLGWGSAASGAQQAEQVILILWHGFTWEDAEMLSFDQPTARGFLNTRTGGGDVLTGAYLSIGAGARAVGVRGAAAFLSREAGEQIYRLHTAQDPGAYIQTSLADIRRGQAVAYRVEPGALGSAVAEAGLAVEALGSSSTLEPVHWAALVAMDRYGRVPQGSLGSELLLPDPRYPFGMHTDYQALLNQVLASEADLVVVDLGDPYRYEEYAHYLLPLQQETVRAIMVGEAREFLQQLAAAVSQETTILVTSPHPGRELAGQGYWLTPVFCLGQGTGLLVSPTTKWPGLITNMDIAPTILAWLGVEHSEPIIGRPAQVEPEEYPEQALAAMRQKINGLFLLRSPVLRLVVIAQIGTYTAVLITLILNSPLPPWGQQLLSAALIVLLSLPLALLFWDYTKLALLVVPLLVVLLQLKKNQPLGLVALIALITALAVSLDIMGGSWLMRYSPLGYDPIGGARFYGIGNEYMGVVVGSSIMAWALWAELAPSQEGWLKGAGLLFFAALTVLMGAPQLGTNVGGAISSVFGFGSTWLSFQQRKLGFGAVVALSLCVVLVLGTFMLIDAANTQDEQSHIGQTVELFRRDGVSALGLIIQRKLAMNVRLLRYSIWSRALLVTLGVMAASFIWPSKFIFWLTENHPSAAKGIGGVVISSFAAFLFNDSGVVAAATCLTFGATPLLLLAMELKHNLAASQPNIENDGHRDQAGEHGAAPCGNKGEGEPSNRHKAQGHAHVDDEVKEEDAGGSSGQQLSVGVLGNGGNVQPPPDQDHKEGQHEH